MDSPEIVEMVTRGLRYTPSSMLAMLLGFVTMAASWGAAMAMRAYEFAGQTIAQAQPPDMGQVVSGAQYVGLAGLIGTIVAALTPLMRMILDDRKEARALRREEIKSAEARHNLANRMQAQEWRMKLVKHGVQSLNSRQRTLIEYATAVRPVLEINRAWMAMASEKHNEPLPEGFGARVFDGVDMDQLLKEAAEEGQKWDEILASDDSDEQPAAHAAAKDSPSDLAEL